MSKKELRRAAKEAKGQEREDCFPKHPARTKVIKEAVSKFQPRTEGQSEYVKAIAEHPITLAIGPAGTGKTFISIAIAMQDLADSKFDKIVLTRPAIEAAGEKLGFLPGDVSEKLDPYMIPLYDSLDKVIGKVARKKLMEEGVIEIVPLAYMRGRTLDKSFIILDEAQNCTPMQIKMLMTRLGIDARLVITGDLNQSDISNAWDNSHNKMRNGLEDAVLRFNNDKDIAVVCLRLCDIQRHPLITHIIKTYELGLPSTTMEDIYKNK
jgi:phosphate starvation-inducible PhoH-like protein